MSGALEVGDVWEDDGEPGGDVQVGPAASRRFLTSSAGGFPLMLTVYAYAAEVDPGADDVGRDLQECIVEDTYLHGVDLAEGDAEPFDSDYTYAWPVDYWSEAAHGPDGQLTLEALNTAAVRHVRSLPLAWLESLPAPPAGIVLPADAHPITGLATL